MEQEAERRRRVFSAPKRSFRMDRRSLAAAALQAAVAHELPRFLGNYTDDTLVEYIVVLVCNGKHQHQARDDLEAFLGDESATFVAWLWDHLNKKELSHNSGAQSGAANDSDNPNAKKNLHLVKVQLGDAHTCKVDLHEPPRTSFKSRCSNSLSYSHTDYQVNSKILVPRALYDFQKLDPTKGQNVSQRCMTSTVVGSTEKLSSKYECSLGGQHQKEDQYATCRSFSMPKSGSARASQALIQEELQHGEHLARNVATRRLPEKAVDIEVPQSTKKRGNVWDRLGKPLTEDGALISESDNIPVQNGVCKKVKSMLAEQEQKCSVNSNRKQELFHEAPPINIYNTYSDVNRVQAHDINSGSSCPSHPGLRENNLRGSDDFSQKSGPTLHVKGVLSRSLYEFTSGVKDLPIVVSEPTCHLKRSSNVSPSNKLSQLNVLRSSRTEVLDSQEVGNPAQSKNGSDIHKDGGNCSNKPVKDEVLDLKLKLKQAEMNVLKLRSEQTQIINGKQGALPGPDAQLEEDADLRTVLVTNVHFAAMKDALSSHFLNCGTVLKVNMLTDAITGRPKGAAYITFAGKESVEKAVALSGTSFFSRVLTVMRKEDAPPGFMATAQQNWKPLQPWNPQPFQKANQKQSLGYHLQWKRDKSV